MRLFKNFFIVSIILIITFSLGFTFWLRDRYVVPILTYHHVGIPSDTKFILNTVSTKSFERQMKFLKKWGYEVISFEDLVEGIKKGYLFSRNTVVIQFDDGYEDNYLNAFPILKKYEIPAMVFLVSDMIDSQGFLTWGQVKEMERYNFLAGAHTRHHQYLPSLTYDKAKDEIAGSKKVIEEHLGHAIDYLVYPSGGFNEKDKQIAKEAGFKAAATTNRGIDRFNNDLFELKRIRVKDSDNNFILWAKLSGYYNLFRVSKSGDCKTQEGCKDKSGY